MKIGVFSIVLNDHSLEEALQKFAALGLQTVEIGCGGYSRSSHMDLDAMLTDPSYLPKVQELLKRYDMTISGLGAQGNPVHPDPQAAAQFHSDFEKTVLVAEKLGVDTVLLLSGCPGGAPGDRTPNWITCPWPQDFSQAYTYQWEEVLIPYWRRAADFAKEHGVKKLAIEPHPGFCVYNPETLLRLRREVGENIGVNLDPSHLFWQGIDILAAVDDLAGCIFHVHAKDSAINRLIAERSGILDPKPYSQFQKRSWNFRTVGYGHSEQIWKDFISRLASVGYDGVISIEHEDAFMPREEGLRKSAEFLRNIVIQDAVTTQWWEMRTQG